MLPYADYALINMIIRPKCSSDPWA